VVGSIFHGKESVKLSGSMTAPENQTSFVIQGSPRDVVNYSRNGNDLTIQMANGRTYTIHNYGAHGFDFNDLVFVSDANVVTVNLGPAIASIDDGILDGLVAETSVASGLSAGVLLGILGAVGAAAGVALGGGSEPDGTDKDPGITLDTPTLDEIVDDEGTITGPVADGGVTNDTSPLVTGTVPYVLPDNTSVEIMRDGAIIGTATVTGTSWSYHDNGLVDGQTYLYSARLVDTSGNKSLSSVEMEITVDTTAPTTPTILQMSNDTDLAGAFISSAHSTVVSGRAEANTIVEILAGQASAATVTVDSTGVWQSSEIDLSGLSPSQAVAITVRSIDAAGNVSEDASVTITYGASDPDEGRVAVGTSDADFIAGTDHNDSLTGAGGADVLLGYGGDDTLTVSNTGFARIDGGEGHDTLVLSGTGLHLDFNNIASDVVTNIETIDITGTGANTITLTAQDVLDLSSTTDKLYVNGDGDDTVEAYGFVITSDHETVGSITYNIYTNGSSILAMDQEITTLTLV